MLDIWCDIANSGPEDTQKLSGLLVHSPIHFIAACPEQLPQLTEITLQGRIKVACYASNADQLKAATELCEIVIVTDPRLVPKVRKAGKEVALWVRVDDGESLQRGREHIGQVDFLIIGFKDETNIPLELLIAAAQDTRTRIVKQVLSKQDAIITHGVLESGPSGVMFAVDTISEALTLTDDLLRSQQRHIALTEVTVTAARHAGMGYRGCIDTTSLLAEDEGMLVGSTSSGGILVCAEVHFLPYMNLRPFRVNAGAVHSYVWADGVTEYITDLRAGITVLAVNTSGVARPVTVGRIKTERRPLRLIEATDGDKNINLFLQDDWHVRVFGADGKPRNCTSVQPGDKLLAHICEAGRHVGIKVTETIEER